MASRCRDTTPKCLVSKAGFGVLILISSTIQRANLASLHRSWSRGGPRFKRDGVARCSCPKRFGWTVGVPARPGQTEEELTLGNHWSVFLWKHASPGLFFVAWKSTSAPKAAPMFGHLIGNRYQSGLSLATCGADGSPVAFIFTGLRV